MRNVKLSFQDIKVSKVYPRAPLDLYAGQQLVLLGRYNQGGKGSITVSGEVDGKVQNQTFPIELKAQSRSNSFLPKLWAARRIANLTEQARENNNPQEIVQEIISLSKKFGIISEFTSFLATDPSESIRRPAPAIVNMPQSAQSSVGASAGRIAFMEDKDGQSFAKAMDAKNESSLGKEKKLDFRVQQVRQAKTNSKLAQLNSVEESPTLTKTRRSKMVGDRCFYFVNNSWIDSLYYLDKPKEKERITFMSKRYLDLLRTTPELRQYLSLGRNVTFVYKNKCYEIIES
jgi:Ca-activated chloride channel family protein